MKNNQIAFELERFEVPLEKLLPVRVVKNPEKKVSRYKEILSSIREVGLIEPLMVYPEKGNRGNYLIVDGHLRLSACKELGMKKIVCIVALDDESYTYNAKISRLAPIQERRMILKAVENGVSIERFAAALNVDVKAIREKLSVSRGLCPEVIEMLKDKHISASALRVLRKVVTSRQIEMVELMQSANDFTTAYAEALFFGTPKNKLIPSASKPAKKVNLEDLAQMETEMESLRQQYRVCEDGFSERMLQLTVLRRYAAKLIGNSKVKRFIQRRHAEIHDELITIVESETC